MRKRLLWGKITSHWVGATVLLNLVGPASAATHEQIVEACREAARPTMIACMQRSRGEGDHDARFEACRQSVGIPFVKACVLREEQKEASGKAAPGVPKLETTSPPPSDALAMRPSYTVPPRTTADINAILEREKPDPAKIAARREAADASLPVGVTAAALAQFHCDRGAARSLLGRNQEALDDGLKALDAAKKSGNFCELRA